MALERTPAEEEILRRDLETLCAAILPEGVQVVVASPDMSEGSLLKTERVNIGRMVPKRLREFTAGRVAARTAMARLGLPGLPLPVGPSREPLWPPGITGSISHCDGVCIAVAASLSLVRTLGLDVEAASPLPQEIEPLVFTSADAHLVREVEAEGAGWVGKMIFSAKESVFKCWFPIEGTFLDFQEASISLDLEAGSWNAQIHKSPSRGFPRFLPGRFGRLEGLIITAAWLPPED